MLCSMPTMTVAKESTQHAKLIPSGSTNFNHTMEGKVKTYL